LHSRNKHQLSNPSVQSELAKNEKASIHIKSASSSFEAFGAYPTESSFPIRLPAEDSLYDVTVYLTDNDNILGGYKQKWAVNANELKSASQITFHVMDQGIVSDDESALFIAGLESYSKQISVPELK